MNSHNNIKSSDILSFTEAVEKCNETLISLRKVLCTSKSLDSPIDPSMFIYTSLFDVEALIKSNKLLPHETDYLQGYVFWIKAKGGNKNDYYEAGRLFLTLLLDIDITHSESNTNTILTRPNLIKILQELFKEYPSDYIRHYTQIESTLAIYDKRCCSEIFTQIKINTLNPQAQKSAKFQENKKFVYTYFIYLSHLYFNQEKIDVAATVQFFNLYLKKKSAADSLIKLIQNTNKDSIEFFRLLTEIVDHLKADLLDKIFIKISLTKVYLNYQPNALNKEEKNILNIGWLFCYRAFYQIIFLNNLYCDKDKNLLISHLNNTISNIVNNLPNFKLDFFIYLFNFYISHFKFLNNLSSGTKDELLPENEIQLIFHSLLEVVNHTDLHPNHEVSKNNLKALLEISSLKETNNILLLKTIILNKSIFFDQQVLSPYLFTLAEISAKHDCVSLSYQYYLAAALAGHKTSDGHIKGLAGVTPEFFETICIIICDINACNLGNLKKTLSTNLENLPLGFKEITLSMIAWRLACLINNNNSYDPGIIRDVLKLIDIEVLKTLTDQPELMLFFSRVKEFTDLLLGNESPPYITSQNQTKNKKKKKSKNKKVQQSVLNPTITTSTTIAPTSNEAEDDIIKNAEPSMETPELIMNSNNHMSNDNNANPIDNDLSLLGKTLSSCNSFAEAEQLCTLAFKLFKDDNDLNSNDIPIINCWVEAINSYINSDNSNTNEKKYFLGYLVWIRAKREQNNDYYPEIATIFLNLLLEVDVTNLISPTSVEIQATLYKLSRKYPLTNDYINYKKITSLLCLYNSPFCEETYNNAVMSSKINIISSSPFSLQKICEQIIIASFFRRAHIYFNQQENLTESTNDDFMRDYDRLVKTNKNNESISLTKKLVEYQHQYPNNHQEIFLLFVKLADSISFNLSHEQIFLKIGLIKIYLNYHCHPSFDDRYISILQKAWEYTYYAYNQLAFSEFNTAELNILASSLNNATNELINRLTVASYKNNDIFCNLLNFYIKQFEVLIDKSQDKKSHITRKTLQTIFNQIIPIADYANLSLKNDTGKQNINKLFKFTMPQKNQFYSLLDWKNKKSLLQVIIFNDENFLDCKSISGYLFNLAELFAINSHSNNGLLVAYKYYLASFLSGNRESEEKIKNFIKKISAKNFNELMTLNKNIESSNFVKINQSLTSFNKFPEDYREITLIIIAWQLSALVNNSRSLQDANTINMILDSIDENTLKNLDTKDPDLDMLLSFNKIKNFLEYFSDQNDDDILETENLDANFPATQNNNNNALSSDSTDDKVLCSTFNDAVKLCNNTLKFLSTPSTNSKLWENRSAFIVERLARVNTFINSNDIDNENTYIKGYITWIQAKHTKTNVQDDDDLETIDKLVNLYCTAADTFITLLARFTPNNTRPTSAELQETLFNLFKDYPHNYDEGNYKKIKSILYTCHGQFCAEIISTARITKNTLYSSSLFDQKSLQNTRQDIVTSSFFWKAHAYFKLNDNSIGKEEEAAFRGDYVTLDQRTEPLEILNELMVYKNKNPSNYKEIFLLFIKLASSISFSVPHEQILLKIGVAKIYFDYHFSHLLNTKEKNIFQEAWLLCFHTYHQLHYSSFDDKQKKQLVAHLDVAVNKLIENLTILSHHDIVSDLLDYYTTQLNFVKNQLSSAKTRKLVEKGFLQTAYNQLLDIAQSANINPTNPIGKNNLDKLNSTMVDKKHNSFFTSWENKKRLLHVIIFNENNFFDCKAISRYLFEIADFSENNYNASLNAKILLKYTYYLAAFLAGEVSSQYRIENIKQITNQNLQDLINLSQEIQLNNFNNIEQSLVKFDKFPKDFREITLSIIAWRLSCIVNHSSMHHHAKILKNILSLINAPKLKNLDQDNLEIYLSLFYDSVKELVDKLNIQNTNEIFSQNQTERESEKQSDQNDSSSKKKKKKKKKKKNKNTSLNTQSLSVTQKQPKINQPTKPFSETTSENVAIAKIDSSSLEASTLTFDEQLFSEVEEHQNFDIAYQEQLKMEVEEQYTNEQLDLTKQETSEIPAEETKDSNDSVLQEKSTLEIIKEPTSVQSVIVEDLQITPSAIVTEESLQKEEAEKKPDLHCAPEESLTESIQPLVDSQQVNATDRDLDALSSEHHENQTVYELSVEEPQTAPSPPLPTYPAIPEITLPKLIVNIINALKNNENEPEKEYRAGLVGSQVWKRLILTQLDLSSKEIEKALKDTDYDFVTNKSREEILALNNKGLGIKISPHHISDKAPYNNLFVVTVDNNPDIKIEILHSDTLNISYEAEGNNRDTNINAMIATTVNNSNKIETIDTTKRGWINLCTKTLETITPPNQSFTTDPKRILRYFSTISSSCGYFDNLYAPHEIQGSLENIIHIDSGELYQQLSKLFMNGHAVENFCWLMEYRILSFIFPGIDFGCVVGKIINDLTEIDTIYKESKNPYMIVNGYLQKNNRYAQVSQLHVFLPFIISRIAQDIERLKQNQRTINNITIRCLIEKAIQDFNFPNKLITKLRNNRFKEQNNNTAEYYDSAIEYLVNYFYSARNVISISHNPHVFFRTYSEFGENNLQNKDMDENHSTDQEDEDNSLSLEEYMEKHNHWW